MTRTTDTITIPAATTSGWPRVRAHLLLALVPLGLAVASAGMAALEEMYTDRRQALADLKAEIAAEVANLDELRALDQEAHDGDCEEGCPAHPYNTVVRAVIDGVEVVPVAAPA